MSQGALLFAVFSAALAIRALVQPINDAWRRRRPLARLTVQEAGIRPGAPSTR